jgi:hypothetical protein
MRKEEAGRATADPEVGCVAVVMLMGRMLRLGS